jgi:hypothetical protein
VLQAVDLTTLLVQVLVDAETLACREGTITPRLALVADERALAMDQPAGLAPGELSAPDPLPDGSRLLRLSPVDRRRTRMVGVRNPSKPSDPCY